MLEILCLCNFAQKLRKLINVVKNWSIVRVAGKRGGIFTFNPNSQRLLVFGCGGAAKDLE
jgi:hypothetical protein